MYLDTILTSFETRKKTYTPRFRVQRDKRGWRMFDGDKAIGFWWPTFCDIWAFSPFEPPEMANVEPPGKVVDLHTLHNTYVNLAPHGWPKHWLDQVDSPSTCLKWQWVKKSGTRLEARITGTFADGERIQWVFGLRYDPAWARYRYTIDIDAWKREAVGMEPLNMMLAGALTARAENRRWTHSVWEDPNGTLRRVVHSNALFHGTDYEDATWRTRNAPYRGAWVAYAAHKSFNPAMLIHQNNVPMRLAICSQLFDEHVIWNTAGIENVDEDGLFHFQMRAEFVNLKPTLARTLLRKAIDPVQPKLWRLDMVVLPFYMDRVNAFEQEADAWQAEDCPVLGLSRDKAAPIQWVTDASHSGRRSIRIQARGIAERQELHPVGAVCNVRPHHRYRLTGWIKTRGVDRFARLELAAYEYQFVNTIDMACTAPVAGTKGWTQVAVELDSGDEAYLMPRLVLYGPGTAWFDDVQLTEV